MLLPSIADSHTNAYAHSHPHSDAYANPYSYTDAHPDALMPLRHLVHRRTGVYPIRRDVSVVV
jgi:hypothetical protein